jgi:superfamily II DNA/RNA helicase
VIAQARSGTGKTGAFGIGILNNLDFTVGHQTQALVLAPTRELATQTYTFMKDIGSKIQPLTIELFVGGHPVPEDERKAINLPYVAIGCPGRVLQLIRSGHLRCENLGLVCLDEADQMLNTDFLDQVKEVFSFLPPGLQVLLFSATIPPETFEHMQGFIDDPIKILVKPEELTLEGITQFYVNVGDPASKLATLFDLYGQLPIQKCVIFANKKETVKYLEEEMTKQQFVVSSTHGELPQQERDRVMQAFRLGTSRVLIGTDLIARGIDVQQVTLVINFELPFDRESYLHRIGRSARFGRKGVAINILEQREMRTLDDLRRHYAIEIPELPHNFVEIVASVNESAAYIRLYVPIAVLDIPSLRNRTGKWLDVFRYVSISVCFASGNRQSLLTHFMQSLRFAPLRMPLLNNARKPGARKASEGWIPLVFP